MDTTQFQSKRVDSYDQKFNSQNFQKLLIRPGSANINTSHTGSQRIVNVSFADKDKKNSSPKDYLKQDVPLIPVHPQSAKTVRTITVNSSNEYYLGKGYFQPESKNLLSKSQTQPNIYKSVSSLVAKSFTDGLNNINSNKKRVPNKIKKEKEALYEGALIVKEQCNNLENENLKLKTQIQQLLKQNAKLNKLISEIEQLKQQQHHQQQQQLQQQQSNGSQIMNLPQYTQDKECKKLSDLVALKDSEIQKYSLSSAQTRVVELEIQLEKYIEQCLTLKIKLDQMERWKNKIKSTREFKIVQQNELENQQLRSDNQYLKGKLLVAEDKLICQQVKGQIVEDKLQDRQLELKPSYSPTEQVSKLEEQLKSSTIQITALKQQLSSVLFINQQLSAIKQQTSCKITERQLLIKMEEKEKKNQELQVEITNLHEQLNESYKRNENEKLKISKERDSYRIIAEDRLKKSNEEAIDRIKIKKNHDSPLKESKELQESPMNSPKAAYIHTLQEIQHQKELQERKNAKRISFKQVSPVNSEQIEDARSLIKFKLTIEKISLEEVLSKYIFTPEIEQQDFITIQHLTNVFKNYPFKFNEMDSENLARYLIEDNSKDTILLKNSLQAENSIVKSRVKYLIGKIRVFSISEEEPLQKIQLKYGEALYSQLNLNSDVKKTFVVSRNQLDKAISYLDLNLTKDQYEFYFMKLFQRSNDPSHFKLDDCCKLFLRQQKQ